MRYDDTIVYEWLKDIWTWAKENDFPYISFSFTGDGYISRWGAGELAWLLTLRGLDKEELHTLAFHLRTKQPVA